ncbi:hypothetical protein D3C76_1680440 [compost metagenome]
MDQIAEAADHRQCASGQRFGMLLQRSYTAADQHGQIADGVFTVIQSGCGHGVGDQQQVGFVF